MAYPLERREVAPVSLALGLKFDSDPNESRGGLGEREMSPESRPLCARSEDPGEEWMSNGSSKGLKAEDQDGASA
jgi:hypothetical protein